MLRPERTASELTSTEISRAVCLISDVYLVRSSLFLMGTPLSVVCKLVTSLAVCVCLLVSSVYLLLSSLLLALTVPVNFATLTRNGTCCT